MDTHTSLYVVIERQHDYRRYPRQWEVPNGWRLLKDSEAVHMTGLALPAYDNAGNLCPQLMSLLRYSG